MDLIKSNLKVHLQVSGKSPKNDREFTNSRATMGMFTPSIDWGYTREICSGIYLGYSQQ